jgi:Inner membrane component of T3SS, cytoplasmic domain
MALILEFRDPHGRTVRQRLDGQPILIGRGLSSDVVLDDAYVDACHARLARDESGAWTIADLGTVNGLYSNGVRLDVPTAVSAGVEIRVGRTVLRFRDSDEPVPPALLDDQLPAPAIEPVVPPESSAAGLGAVPRGGRLATTLLATTLLATTRGRLVLVAAMLAAFALNGWLSDTTRSPGSEVFSMMLAIGALVSAWAVVWAAATRRADRRFHFLGHLAAISAALLSAVVIVEINEWLTFLFPGAAVVAVVYVVAYLVIAAMTVALHLGVSGTMPARGRWRTGFLVAGAILALTLFAALVKDETFSDVPKFQAGMKPLSAAVVPAQGVDDFGAVMRKAKREADDASKKAVDP